MNLPQTIIVQQNGIMLILVSYFFSCYTNNVFVYSIRIIISIIKIDCFIIFFDLSGSWRAVYRFSNKSMSIIDNLPSILAQESMGDVMQVALLPAVNDEHGGLIVELEDPMDSTVFHTSLQASITNWRTQGIKGVWIKLPLKLANLVEAAVEEGFWYHHAEPNYLMLVRWLPDTMHTIPVNASHRVGVGAFVMNDKREVLVVQEKSGMHRGSGLWKFPTGVVDQAEDIHAGAIREVKEETGVDTEFIEVLAFRQSHMAFFEKSDLFFVCMLRPLTHDIHPQETEIEAAQWMPIEEYAAQPLVQKHDLLKYTLDVCLAKMDKDYSGFAPVCTGPLFSKRLGCLYLNKRDLNRASTSGTHDLI
ncbi:nudix hydrolase 2 isoform X1 [Canna indica]|uniref:Nudix hydrolase 2 isoform X1 n=1 Tax=Canna indica TaxID=4628 RepID=A0AAQ3L269_9LILI|nr:nudix hydrolase 2 isoform X1 [Canna indica]